MSAAHCGIIFSGHCSKKGEKINKIKKKKKKKKKRIGIAFKVRGRRGGATLWYLLVFFAPLYKNIGAMYLKLHVNVLIVISFHSSPKTASKSHMPRIFGKNLKFGLFPSKIFKIQFSVILTSLKRHCNAKWRATGTFLKSMEKWDSYLSSSTKIIRIGGLIANI